MEQEIRIGDAVNIRRIDKPEFFDGYGWVKNLWYDEAANQYMCEIEVGEDNLYRQDNYKTEVYPISRIKVQPAIYLGKDKVYIFKSSMDCEDAIDRCADGEELTGWIECWEDDSEGDELVKNIYTKYRELKENSEE